MIYRDPRSGQTQDVAERETVRRQILEQAGWVVADVSQETLPPDPAAVIEDAPKPKVKRSK